MAVDKPGRGSDQFPLRLPDGMRDRIKAAADANGRSMNAEIISALLVVFPEPQDAETAALLQKFEALPEEAREKFILEALGKMTFVDEDAIDGIFPGSAYSLLMGANTVRNREKRLKK